MKTKKILLALSITIATILLVVLSCEKESDPPAGKSSFAAGTVPTVTEQDAQNITFTGAEISVQVTSTGNRLIKRLCICYSTIKPVPDTLGQVVELGPISRVGAYKATLQNLTHNTKYYFRAYSRNMIGSCYSETLDFTTLKDARLPEVTTETANDITSTSATLSGTITSFGQSTTAIQHGHIWATHSNPTLTDNKTQLGSTSSTTITSNVTGLLYTTTYYYRAYVTNNYGTTYGEIRTFRTSTITDVDGNAYNIVTIGTQTWMAENLRTSKYNDGTAIPYVTDDMEWSTPAYSWYNHDASTYKNSYGALYNWYTVNTGKLCPANWHVPTDDEWTVLTDYLGGTSVAGGKLKETGTTHWRSPNAGATNESRFTALPVGYYRYDNGGMFGHFGLVGYWWSSTEYNTLKTTAWNRQMIYTTTVVDRNYLKKSYGLSVRCIKDE
ncbi:MAG: fibrobacter succinogenes major paralogous domain-containing protein [Bacteroidales bacterium]